ncbi:MAG: anthranilate synthase component I family protein [Phycisphaerales bacterium JB054]
MLAPQSPGYPGNAWIGWLAYDLADAIEPGVLGRNADTSQPLAMLQRVDLSGHAPHPTAPAAPPTRTVLRSHQGREAYKRSVHRALEYIRAGDVYQANIAHQFAGRYSGSPAELFAALAASADPVHGLGLVSTHTPRQEPAAPGTPAGEAIAVLSLSPELFLAYDAPTRRITTRPMKGTRPGHADPHELRDAEKDRAELAMIVDLMRNDLGRVCEFGSVRVDDPRAIERHASGPGAVLQATATVSGTVREGTTTTDILAATFPPGSVTGTPKLRAMQIIDELEPFARGPYCGCLGLFHDNGSFELAVAIRTVVIRGAVKPGTDAFDDALLTYCVGAGIVADSDPESEWLETLDKAGVLNTVFDIQTD